MTKYKSVHHAPHAAKHKGGKQQETPQMRKPEPYSRPGKRTYS